MCFQNILTRQDFELIKWHAKNRGLYKFENSVKTADGKIGLSIELKICDKEIADEIWGGDNLLVYVSFDSRQTNKIGGAGRAFSATEFGNKEYNDFAEYIERIGSCYLPDNYEKFSRAGEQLSFFEV